MLCNTHVKFDLFHQKAIAIGAEKIATGHYARITRRAADASSCARRVDLAKDQSYFLFELSQAQLAEALFPLGEMTKPEVRDIAEEAGLSVARKKESYEICFVPEKDGYAKIVEREAGIAAGEGAGEIVDIDGNVVGTHDGYYQFTIGQRRGLDIGGTPERTYVVDVNPFTKRVDRRSGVRAREGRADRRARALDRRRAAVRTDRSAGARPLAHGRRRRNGDAARRRPRARRRSRTNCAPSPPDRRSSSIRTISVWAAAGSRALRKF